MNDLYQQLQDFTMTSRKSLAATCRAVEHVMDNGIPGAFVECGVWKGGCAMAMAITALHQNVDDREIWMYDTFAGMTEPTDLDRTPAGHLGADILAAAKPTDHVWAIADVIEVRVHMSWTNYPPERIKMVEGNVVDTIPLFAPDLISVLRLDTDWYESTLHELTHLYPLLSPGGILIVDDYGHWEGARNAVDSYNASLEQPFQLEQIDYTCYRATKPKETPNVAPKS